MSILYNESLEVLRIFALLPEIGELLFFVSFSYLFCMFQCHCFLVDFEIFLTGSFLWKNTKLAEPLENFKLTLHVEDSLIEDWVDS